MNRTVTIDQTNILRYCYFISKEFYLIVVYLYLLCIHCQLCKLQLQWLAPNWCKGAVVTVYHTQLPLSNLNFVFIAVSIAATRFVIVVFDGGLVSSSDVRNIVILRVNLIKVTSSSYRHQLSPSSRHNRGGANISSESKDVSNWSLSSTFIADHKPSTELRVWCININPTRPGCPFFIATKDSRLSRYPDVVACPGVPLLRYGGVTLADLCLPYDADIVLWGTVRSERRWIGVGVAEIEMLRV